MKANDMFKSTIFTSQRCERHVRMVVYPRNVQNWPFVTLKSRGAIWNMWHRYASDIRFTSIVALQQMVAQCIYIVVYINILACGRNSPPPIWDFTTYYCRFVCRLFQWSAYHIMHVRIRSCVYARIWNSRPTLSRQWHWWTTALRETNMKINHWLSRVHSYIC